MSFQQKVSSFLSPLNLFPEKDGKTSIAFSTLQSQPVSLDSVKTVRPTKMGRVVFYIWYMYVYLPGSSFRGVEWMIRGAEKHHPLGLKQHLLEDAGT